MSQPKWPKGNQAWGKTAPGWVHLQNPPYSAQVGIPADAPLQFRPHQFHSQRRLGHLCASRQPWASRQSCPSSQPRARGRWLAWDAADCRPGLAVGSRHHRHGGSAGAGGGRHCPPGPWRRRCGGAGRTAQPLHPRARGPGRPAAPTGSSILWSLVVSGLLPTKKPVRQGGQPPVALRGMRQN